MHLRVVLVALLAVLGTAGCELRLATDIAVGPQGSGTLSIEVALDDELRALLQDAGFDPTEGLEDLRARAPDWTVEVTEREAGLSIALQAEFADVAEFAALTDSFHAALGEEDGRLFDGLRLDVDERGRVAFRGEVGLVPPTSPGVDGEGIRFDAAAFAAFVEERGEEFVRYDLRVALPAQPAAHDADAVEGNTLVWSAPVGSLRSVMAQSEVPPGTPTWVAAAVVAGAAVVGGLVVTLARRAGRRRRPGRGRGRRRVTAAD